MAQPRIARRDGEFREASDSREHAVWLPFPCFKSSLNNSEPQSATGQANEVGLLT